MTRGIFDALAYRAVKCKGWRWMAGMQFIDEHGAKWRIQSDAHAVCIHADRLPDLSDPATLGCLLALVRGAWRNPCIGIRGWRDSVDPDHCWVVVYDSDDDNDSSIHIDGNSEAEALVAALEAAP